MGAMLKVYVDTRGGSVKRKEVDADKIRQLPEKIRTSIAGRMVTLAENLLDDLWWGYLKAIRVRPRLEGEHLLDRLRKAMQKTVNSPERQVWVGMFELGMLDRMTRNEGRSTQDKGWFMNLEDGHGDTPRHGSKDWAYVDLDRAVELADDAANHLKLDATRRAKFVADVKEKFAGRHGNGIMVQLDEPLFFDFPEYGRDPGQKFGRGKARNIVGRHGHPGYPALDVMPRVAKDWQKEIKQVAYKAIEDAGNAL